MPQHRTMSYEITTEPSVSLQLHIKIAQGSKFPSRSPIQTSNMEKGVSLSTQA